jgi:hypothetical protein
LIDKNEIKNFDFYGPKKDLLEVCAKPIPEDTMEVKAVMEPEDTSKKLEEIKEEIEKAGELHELEKAKESSES